MKQKELEALMTKVDDLKSELATTKEKLVRARVLEAEFKPYSINKYMGRYPISLESLRDQIDAIKNFLRIEYVTEPAIPAKSTMKRIQSGETDERP